MERLMKNLSSKVPQMLERSKASLWFAAAVLLPLLVSACARHTHIHI
jgi:hypothetical protein